MNTKLPLIVSIAAVALLHSSALAADNRFDGIWVGTETVIEQEFHGTLKVEKSPHTTSAKIVIAQGGTLLVVIEGYGPGRYKEGQRFGKMIAYRADIRT